MLGSGRSASAPPEKCSRRQYDHGCNKVETLQIALEPLPVLPEEIACAGNYSHPQRGTEKIKNQEFPPWHAQNPCHRSGNNSHAEDKTCNEDRGCAVFSEKSFSAFERALLNAENCLIPGEQSSPAIEAQRETQVVAHGRSDRRYGNDPRKTQVMFGVRQKARHQQDGFARHGNSGILCEQGEAYGPISVVHHRIPQQVENGVGHDFAGGNLLRLCLLVLSEIVLSGIGWSGTRSRTGWNHPCRLYR